MRNILLFLLLLGVAGCNDFLEESSQDEIRPSTVEDLMQVMTGEGYPMNFLEYGYTELLTDNVKCNGSSSDGSMISTMDNMRSLFLWEDDMFEKLTEDGYNSWKALYRKIMGCNTILGYIDKVSGSQEVKNNLCGQAYVLRAYYYFLLVNYYGMPYNVGVPMTYLGVPLILEIDVYDGFMKRNTVAEVYDQIVKDLEVGIQLLEEHPKDMSLYKINALAGEAILCRVYLYMEDWDHALEYANKVLKKKPTLLSFASMPTGMMEPGFMGPTWSVYNLSVSDEIIWMYGDYKTFSSCFPSLQGSIPPFSISEDLQNLYEYNDWGYDTESGQWYYNYGDLRLPAYYQYVMDFTTMFVGYIFGYKGGPSQNYASFGIRTAEMYLNRAEAHIRKFMETGNDEFRVLALADLNRLRATRFDTQNVAYKDVDFSDKDDLWNFYEKERRRELAFEGHRWFDLRRFGMPELTHIYFVEKGLEETVTLQEGDPRYVLPIPPSAMDNNTYLTQNKR